MLDDAVALARELGEPRHGYAILAEGNVSALVDEGSMLVTASGASLRDACRDSFLEVRLDDVLAPLGDGPLDEPEPGAARPSVEAPLHAVALRHGGARFVGHTHPTAVNAILCSEHAADLARPLFPDQIVVCGAQPVFLPYVEPGLPVARALREELCARAGAPPQTIYLQSHGLVALGQSADEVLRVTAMAAKAAAILAGALAAGGAVFLSEEEAAAIDGRPDEAYRREVLARRGSR